MCFNMQSHDPNIEWIVHEVEVTLMKFDFIGIFKTSVGGNAHRRDVLNAAIENLIDDFNGSVILTNSKGDTLVVKDELSKQRKWLDPMIVGLRIIVQKTSEGEVIK